MPTATTEPRFYDEGWEREWDDMKRYSPVGRHTRRWILKLLRRVPSPERIADIGCGEGSLLCELRRAYPSAALFGSDFSRVAIESCKGRISTATLAVQDIRDANNPFGCTIDVGINSEVIEHMDEHELAVRNMGRWCRYLILTVPGGRLDDTARKMGHLRHYDVASLRRIAEQAGLDVLYCRAWGFPLAYPLYARLRDGVGYETVTGHYGWQKRTLCHVLTAAFYVNDLFSSGNKVFLLARNPRLA